MAAQPHDLLSRPLPRPSCRRRGGQIDPCPKLYAHDWAACPCGHQGERAARRNLRVIPYRSIACPYAKKKLPCPDGDQVRRPPAPALALAARWMRGTRAAGGMLLIMPVMHFVTPGTAKFLCSRGRRAGGALRSRHRRSRPPSLLPAHAPFSSNPVQCLNAHNLFEYCASPG
jgi:hypothetical protein